MRSLSILLALAALPLAAQDHRKPNLTSPAPRLNGKSDLSGIWEAERTPRAEYSRVLGPAFAAEQVDYDDLTKESISLFWGMKPQDEPLTAAGAAMLKRHQGMPPTSARCLPVGVPASLFIYSFKIVQAPRETVLLAGTGDPARQIPTDGRAIPSDPGPSWMGYSVGKWQDDTFSVQTTGFNEGSWLDLSGHPRSESTRVRENYHRRDFGHMDYEVTIEDPKYYIRPVGFKASFHLVPGDDFPEFVCAENEKDRAHLR